MPELPEVETIARGLHARIAGAVVASVHLSRADVLHGASMPPCAVLMRRRIRRVSRVGKYLRIETEGPADVCIHLGMSGRLVVTDRDAPLRPHTHLRITFQRRRIELRYCDPRRFGGLWLVPRNGEAPPGWIGRRLPPAGVDPLESSPARLRSVLKRGRQIKALLLDQRTIGGVGNIYCDEALYRARIHPAVRAGDLDDGALRRLSTALRAVLREAIRSGGSSISDYITAEGRPGSYQHRHRVYGRAGKPCRCCGATIERCVVAGRGTFICPACQVAPASAHR
jgi:formamidopyrimidine-DNA glycosylase